MPSTWKTPGKMGRVGKGIQTAQFLCLSVPTSQTYQLSSSQTQTTKEEFRVSGALSTASRNPEGNCDSLLFPAEAMY